MAFKYTAKIYFDDDELFSENGNDLDELYNWMLMKAQGKFGNLRGEIIDNKTKKVVKSFKKAPTE